MADSSRQWVKASIGLATFSFINLVLFIALSNPFGLLMDTIEEQSEVLNLSGQVNHHVSNIRIIFGVVFVLSAFGAIAWFFIGSHEEEHVQM
jgi:hypothetical protein